MQAAFKNSLSKVYHLRVEVSSIAFGLMDLWHLQSFHTLVLRLQIQAKSQKEWRHRSRVTIWKWRTVRNVQGRRRGSRQGHITAVSVGSAFSKWITTAPGWTTVLAIATWSTSFSSWFISCFHQQLCHCFWFYLSTTYWWRKRPDQLWGIHGTHTASSAPSLPSSKVFSSPISPSS